MRKLMLATGGDRAHRRCVYGRLRKERGRKSNAAVEVVSAAKSFVQTYSGSPE